MMIKPGVYKTATHILEEAEHAAEEVAHGGAEAGHAVAEGAHHAAEFAMGFHYSRFVGGRHDALDSWAFSYTSFLIECQKHHWYPKKIRT